MATLINLTVFKRFLSSNYAGGILLFSCVIISLIIANSPLAEGFNQFFQQVIGYESESIQLKYSVKLWIDDGLMAIFFLLVGLEIKRELVEGELSSPKKAALPIVAAIGGALVPAGIYIALNFSEPTHHGWGIPMATDIAFALAIITLLGKKVPASLKIFLAALAIVDDLLAILVIAIFYSSDMHLTYLMYAGGIGKVGTRMGTGLALAVENWRTQQEPPDAALLVEAALALNQPQAGAPVLDWMQTTGYTDPTLAPLAQTLRTRLGR